MDNQEDQNFSYQPHLYIITAKTNLHVGSGEESYGLVDNRVQRDVVNNLPNINSSGLKGAFREHFSCLWRKDSEKITEIFGSDSFSQPEKHQAGKFRFFSANLLSLPVRSDVRPFFRATSPEVVQDLIGNLDTFAYEDKSGIRESLKKLLEFKSEAKNPILLNGDKEARLEDFNLIARSNENKKLDQKHLEILEKLIGEHIVLLHHSDFADICSDYNLPLIARNRLEDGRSTNLWHEQVVPRETKFYFFVLKPDDYKNGLEFKDDEPVQIGANASIGYGFCLISPADKLPGTSGSEENKS